MNHEEFKRLLARGEATDLEWKRDFPPGLLKGRGNQADYNQGKATLLKDLVSIANAAGVQYGYLIYGVQDEGPTRSVIGTSKTWDDADFQTWARNAFNPAPKFIYEQFLTEDGKNIGVFTIERVPDYPHVTVQTLGNVLFDGQVWFRQGTQNRIAHRDELRTMLLGEKPFTFSRLETPEFKSQVIDYYRELGEEVMGPRFYDRDMLLATGWRLAYYPGTRREIWGGEVDGRFEHIYMLKPKESV